MDEVWQLYMAMGTVLAVVVTAVAFGWRVSSAMRKENREAHAGIRTEIQTFRGDLGAEIAGVRKELGAEIAGVRKELGAEIAENREAIGGLREDLAAFKGHMDAKIDAHGARNRPPGGESRQDRRGRGVHQGAPDRRGPGLSHTVARLVGRCQLYRELVG